VEAILANHGRSLIDFNRWMTGQTVGVCDGRSYNHATREYEIACGGIEHGMVTYGVDLQCFLGGGRPLD
jgi:hypothetical protein